MRGSMAKLGRLFAWMTMTTVSSLPMAGCKTTVASYLSEHNISGHGEGSSGVEFARFARERAERFAPETLRDIDETESSPATDVAIQAFVCVANVGETVMYRDAALGKVPEGDVRRFARFGSVYTPAELSTRGAESAKRCVETCSSAITSETTRRWAPRCAALRAELDTLAPKQRWSGALARLEQAVEEAKVAATRGYWIHFSISINSARKLRDELRAQASGDSRFATLGASLDELARRHDDKLARAATFEEDAKVKALRARQLRLGEERVDLDRLAERALDAQSRAAGQTTSDGRRTPRNDAALEDAQRDAERIRRRRREVDEQIEEVEASLGKRARELGL